MTITLQTEVKNLKGVGPAKAAALARLGIKTVEELLHHYPSGYTFAPTIGGPTVDGQPATMVGVVAALNTRGWAYRDFGVSFVDGVRVKWYGGQYLRSQIFKGTHLMVSGVVQDMGFVNPEFRILKPDETPDPSVLDIVTYPVVAGITSKDIGRLIRELPDTVFTDNVLACIHEPFNQEEADWGRRCLKRDELFYMQLGLAVRRAKQMVERTNVRCYLPPQDITAYFPFPFTDDQIATTNDICRDLHAHRPMNRLLQGDVGCGKTAVAAYAAIVMAFNGG
jgi:ATP-dependent DNA helicase RecG